MLAQLDLALETRARDMVQALTGTIPGRRVSIRHYIGLDASPELVKRAKNRYPQATVVRGDGVVFLMMRLPWRVRAA